MIPPIINLVPTPAIHRLLLLVLISQLLIPLKHSLGNTLPPGAAPSPSFSTSQQEGSLEAAAAISTDSIPFQLENDRFSDDPRPSAEVFWMFLVFFC
jgi:hypothetical protein